jgi:hypothetical protein
LITETVQLRLHQASKTKTTNARAPNRPKKTICEIALNVNEAKKLIGQGFRYETGEYDNGGKLFAKEQYI